LRVTIASLDSRNQGAAALEVLFHEGSHGIAEPVQAAIIRECRQRDKAIPRDLWHALVFYTPVKLSAGAWHFWRNRRRPGGQRPGGGYTPYAVREGLYQRAGATISSYCRNSGNLTLTHASFDDAIARMVSSL